MINRPNPNSFRLLCGCVATDTGESAWIAYCPMHKDALGLLDVLKDALDDLGAWSIDHLDGGSPYVVTEKIIADGRTIIDRIEGA